MCQCLTEYYLLARQSDQDPEPSRLPSVLDFSRSKVAAVFGYVRVVLN